MCMSRVFEVLLEGIFSMDERVVPLQEVSMLQPLLPTPEERELLLGYSGDVRQLSPVDYWLRLCAEAGPSLAARVRGFAFYAEFPALVRA
jgi:hypothetical protein